MGFKRELFTSVLEADSRASGSPFSAATEGLSLSVGERWTEARRRR